VPASATSTLSCLEQNAHSCSGCRTNSGVAIITVTVGIASAAVAAMFPAAGTTACWQCLRLPDQYHLPIHLNNPDFQDGEMVN